MDNHISVNWGRDGTWLTFAASNGREVSIRAEDIKVGGPIMRDAMRQWIEDRRSEHHVHVAGTTAGKHIDECAKCGRDIRDPIHQS